MTYDVGRCRVPELLKRRKLNQQDLVDGIGLTKQSVSKICNNAQVMSYQTALKVAKFLGVSMEELYEIRKIRHRE
jgi:putative transcriptional regulator